MPFKATVDEILRKYELIVGLEIHIELRTKHKMFCECSADWFGKAPNTQTCPVCLGMPGALPVPNKEAILSTIKIARALNCEINLYQQFDRKHYFYPDLPKGYQITQFYYPVGNNGKVEIPTEGGGFKTVRINRIHIEEDTGKLTHTAKGSLIDFNRSGVPLVEIVTEPDFRSPYEVKTFLKLLQALVRLLGVSSADMEKGSMRLEPNISLRQKGTDTLPSYKVEVKNINSFNFVVKAIEYEVLRQGRLLLEGKTPAQETRGFDTSTGKTVSQRRKESAQDYRYLPDPDIPPIQFTKTEVEQIQLEKSSNAYEIFVLLKKAGIDEKAIWVMLDNPWVYKIFLKVTKDMKDPKVLQYLKRYKVEEIPFSDQKFARFLQNTYNKNLYRDAYKALETYYKMYKRDTVDKNTIARIVREVIQENPKAVTDYKAGKQSAIQFLIGKFMQKLRKKIDLAPVISLLKEELEKQRTV